MVAAAGKQELHKSLLFGKKKKRGTELQSFKYMREILSTPICFLVEFSQTFSLCPDRNMRVELFFPLSLTIVQKLRVSLDSNHA